MASSNATRHGAQPVTSQDGEGRSFAEMVSELALSYASEQAPGPQIPLVEQIVSGALAVLPGTAAAAVVTADHGGRLSAALMVGDEMAREVMDAQNRCEEGPCSDALRGHRQVAAMDLSVEGRWPAFGIQARRAGVAAVVCTPMEVDGYGVGVLTLLSREADFGDVEEDIESLARVFATHAGLALTGARRLANITGALSSREVIGQAKGILMERFKITPDLAFAVLVRASSLTNTKLRTVCADICDTGALPGGLQ